MSSNKFSMFYILSLKDVGRVPTYGGVRHIWVGSSDYLELLLFIPAGWLMFSQSCRKRWLSRHFLFSSKVVADDAYCLLFQCVNREKLSLYWIQMHVWIVIDFSCVYFIRFWKIKQIRRWYCIRWFDIYANWNVNHNVTFRLPRNHLFAWYIQIAIFTPLFDFHRLFFTRSNALQTMQTNLRMFSSENQLSLSINPRNEFRLGSR